MKKIAIISILLIKLTTIVNAQYLNNSDILVIPSVFKGNGVVYPDNCGNSNWNGYFGSFTYPSTNAIGIPNSCVSSGVGNGPHQNGTFHFDDDYWAQDWNWGSGCSDLGIPLFTPSKSKILNTKSGQTRLCNSTNGSGFGNSVTILLDFNSTLYHYAIKFNHLEQALISSPNNTDINDPIRNLNTGVQIGTLGTTGNSTGPHLHISVYKILKTDVQSLKRLMKGINPSGNSISFNGGNSVFSQEFIIDMNLSASNESVNFKQPIFCGLPTSPSSNVPVVFPISSETVNVANITDIAIVNYDGDNDATNDVVKRNCTLLPSSIKNCGNKYWQFKFSINSPNFAWDVTQKYTLRFNVIRSDNISGLKYAKDQVTFRNASGFTDLTNSFYKCYVENGIKNALFSGKTFNTFDPEGSMTRGEMTKVIVNAAIRLGDIAGNTAQVKQYNLSISNGEFTDITTENSWYPYVQTLRNAQALNGIFSNNEFKPNEPASIGLFCRIASKVFNINADNVNDFKKIVPKIIVSNNANPLYKVFLERILGTYAKANCNSSTGIDEEATIAINEFLTNNITTSATIYGTELIKRKAMARMINGLFYYSLDRQGGNIGSRTNNSIYTLSSNNNKTILGSKHEVQDGFSNTLTHPFNLSTVRIGLTDSLSIGTNTIKDNNGNEIYFYWVLNNGFLVEKNQNLNKVVFYPENMQMGDTAKLYSFVANNLGQFSEGIKLIIIGNTQPPTSGVNINLSSNNLNFGNINVGANSTQTFTITNPSTSSNILNGNVAITGNGYSIITGSGAFSLVAGTSKTITVKFTASAAGNASGSVSITHNASNMASPTAINLSGTGISSSSGTSSTINCNTTNILSCGTSNYGNTIGKQNNITSYCNSLNAFAANEDVWKYTATANGIVSVYYWAVNANQKLFIFNSCSNTNNCIKQIEKGYTETINVTSGTTYYFIVDGLSGANGSYEIKPSCPIQIGGSGTLGNDCPTFSPAPYVIQPTQQFSTLNAIFSSTTSAHSGKIKIVGPDAAFFKFTNTNSDSTTYSLNGYSNLGRDVWFTYQQGIDQEREYFAEFRIENTSSMQNVAGPGPCNNTVKSIPIYCDARRPITWTKPIGGETYLFNFLPENNITYSYNFIPSTNADIQLSKDGGITWLPTWNGQNSYINFTGNNSYLPDANTLLYGSKNCKLRIKEQGNQNWYVSPGLFTIKHPITNNDYFHITYPEVNEEFDCSQPINIKWKQFGVAGYGQAMKLSFSRNGGITWNVNDTIGTIIGNDVMDYEYSKLWNPPIGLLSDSLVFKIDVPSIGHSDLSDGLSIYKCTSIPVLNITTNFTNPACAIANNGSITITPSGGSGTYTYTWKKNGTAIVNTSASIANQGVGNYDYSINDGIGLTANGTIVLSANNPLVLSMASTASLCTKNNGSANVIVTGGSGNYNYTWSNGATTNNINNIATGSYIVDVVDNTNGCTQSNVVFVPNVGSDISLSFNSPPNICDGATTLITTTVTGGTAPFTYYFNNVLNATNNKLMPVGVHTISVTDANGCTGINTIEVKQNLDIYYSLEVNDAICNTLGVAKIITNGGTGTYQYKWDNGAYQNSNQKVLDTGKHIITVFDGICTVQDTFYINYTKPEAYFESSSIEVEVGDTAVRFSNYSYGNTSQKWFYNDVQEATTIDYQKLFITPGIHEIKLVIYNNNCTDTIKQTVTVYPQLNFATQIVKEICDNGKGKIIVNSIGGKPNYLYSIDSISWRSINTFDTLQSGIYNIWLSDSLNKIIKKNVIITDSFSIINSNAIVENIKCFGNNNGKIALNPINGTNPYKYLWSTSINDTSALIQNLNIGMYNVKLIDKNGCIKYDTFNITQPTPIVTSNLTTAASCLPNGAINLIASGGTPNYTYLWSNSATTPVVNNLATGNYVATITDNNNCIKQVTVSVPEDRRFKSNGSVIDTMNIILNKPTPEYCVGDSIKLTVPLYNDIIYQWYKNGVVINNANANSIWVKQAGTYNCLSKDVNTCIKNSNIITIVENALPITSLTLNGKDTLCGNQQSIIQAVPGYANYVWSTGATTNAIVVNATGNYFVDITTLKGCKARSNSVAINKFALPIVNITPSGLLQTCEKDTITLQATNGFFSYLWNTTETTTSVKKLQSGIYNVKVKDVNGCENTSNNTQLVFNPKPPKPLISLIGVDSLVSNQNGFTYKWKQWIINTAPNGVETYTPLLTNGSTIFATTKSIKIQLIKALYTVSYANNFNCETVSDTFRYIPSVNPILHVSPNPATGQVNLFIEGLDNNADYFVVFNNNIGQQVFARRIKAINREYRENIKLSNLASGIYYIVLRDFNNKAIANIKLIKN